MCDFDTPVTLIAVKVTGRDDIGNPIRVEKSSEAWAELMLLRHIRRTPPGNDNFSLITVFVEECG